MRWFVAMSVALSLLVAEPAMADGAPTTPEQVSLADVIVEGQVKKVWTESVQLASGQRVPMQRLVLAVDRVYKGQVTEQEVVLAMRSVGDTTLGTTLLVHAEQASSNALLARPEGVWRRDTDRWGRDIAAALLPDAARTSFGANGAVSWSDTRRMVRDLVQLLPGSEPTAP